jgi:ABC-type nitrate/sulfonate/bicarbonate transport system permease component
LSTTFGEAGADSLAARAEALADLPGAPGQVLAPARSDDEGGMPAWLGGLIGTLLLLGIWEVLALTVFNSIGSGVPTPVSVVTQFWNDLTSGLYGRNVGQTLKEAANGYLVGNLLAIGLGIAFVLVPFLEKALLRLAIASYCLPLIAVGPILSFALSGDRPQSALAALLVFFPTLVGVVLGLRSVDQASLDLIYAAGGGRWAQLVKARLKAALPSTFAALQIAAPSAILGAIIGEYLGRQNTGLGIMMIDAETSLSVSRTWGIALFCAAIAGTAYFLTGVIGKLLTPWARAKS